MKPANFFLLLAASILMIATVCAYWPGSSGGFILDDYASLKALGKNGGITDLDAAMRYALSGKESFVGRPLARLSLVLNGQSWPADSFPFKVSNIIIHAFTTLLLVALFYQLLRIINSPPRTAATIAFSGAMLWGLHPAQISTVLYIVQRMTELSALFILAGLLCYLAGRKVLNDTPRRGYALMTTGVVFFGLLSFLSKETGVLIAVLIAVLELTLLTKISRPRHWRLWAVPILGVPLSVIVGYFLMVIINHESSYAQRDFGLYERLLTQPRVLLDYIGNLLLPIATPSVLHDDFEVSSGLFSPLTTLPSILVIAALLVVGWRLRAKHPMLSFAILWFFGAHLLESTVLPLEIYFEHRNYLPSVGPALAVAFYLYRLLAAYGKTVYSAVVVLLGTIMFGGVWHYSGIWGDEQRLAQVWVDEAPQSVRRMVFKMNHYLMTGDLKQADRVAAVNYQRHPGRLGVQIFNLATGCISNRLGKQDYTDVVQAAHSRSIDTETMPALIRLYEGIAKGYCKQISWRGLEHILNNLLANPDIEQWQWIVPNAYKMIGEINRTLERFPKAVTAYKNALAAEPGVDLALKLAYFYFTAGEYQQAQHYIAEAKRIDGARKLWLPSQQTRIDAAQRRVEEAIQQHGGG
jgi:hypothetical protein